MRRCLLILLSFGLATSLAAFVPPFATGQFAVFGIQARCAATLVHMAPCRTLEKENPWHQPAPTQADA